MIPWEKWGIILRWETVKVNTYEFMFSRKGVKMRLLILLIALMFCVSVLLIGCDPAMRQPIMEVVTPPQHSLEKAQAAMERVNEDG